MVRNIGRIGAAAVVAFLTLAVAAPAWAVSEQPVMRLADGSLVPGARSTLVTSDSGARATLRTSELPGGHTITLWWVVFNEPARCTHGPGVPFRCGAGDLPPFGGDDSAVASVLYAAGHLIGGSGRATFGASLSTGDDDAALFGPGLVNPTGAEIHLVVHDHGVLTPQQQAEGIHNFGPCNSECVDLQASVHAQ